MYNKEFKEQIRHLLTKISIGESAYGVYSTINKDEDSLVDFLESKSVVFKFESETNHYGKYAVKLTSFGADVMKKLNNV